MSSDALQACYRDLVAASRILSAEGVIDSFGHCSFRHPERSDRYVMPRVRAAELVEASDLLEFDLHGTPQPATDVRIFAERAIHGAIYNARPDVMAVCHHHAPTMLPFCVSGVPLVPVFHLGATMGETAPLWDSQDEFGDTNLLVSTREQGTSLARTLGSNWTVLMRGHGVAVAGRSVRELVFRCIYGARNAQILLQATQLGGARQLTPGEARSAAEFNLQPFAMDRAWEQWSRRIGAN